VQSNGTGPASRQLQDKVGGVAPAGLLLIERCIATLVTNVHFSNRPFGVKHFQTIHRYSVDVARGLVLLFGIGTKGPSIMGFEDEAAQSVSRPCHQTNGRSKRTYELTSSIVPRGTSFHCSVECEFLLLH
jgi:hypothetical protein